MGEGLHPLSKILINLSFPGKRGMCLTSTCQRCSKHLTCKKGFKFELCHAMLSNVRQENNNLTPCDITLSSHTRCVVWGDLKTELPIKAP